MDMEYERRGESKIFKVDFDIRQYGDILPNHIAYQQDDYILNGEEWQKGNVENCYWQKHIPTKDEIASSEWKRIEAKRCLKSGVFIAIKEEVLWIPPSYYTVLQYGSVMGDDLQFRLKRLKHVYHKIRVRNNRYAIGSLTIKNRADGETTMAMADGLWECADGNMTAGIIGIQSKTNDDGKMPCWSTIQILWQAYPNWLKQMLYPDFDSGDNIAQKLFFTREADYENDIPARHVTIKYFPAVYNAMDGKHGVKKCILDEVCKYRECDFYDVFTNYSKFISPGFERKGIFDMFSSPSDVPCKSNEQVYELWKNSNPDELDSRGTTVSGVFRYFSNPLEGVQGAYDKYGDADPEQIYDWIMKVRKTVPKDKLMGEIRGFPLNEEEAFGSFDSGSLWANMDGIKKRQIYLIGRRFKDDKTQEPINIYGNLERVDGYIDGDVEFRPTDRASFDLKEARFCFSFLPQNKEPLKNIFKPPAYVENSLGLDPFNNRYEAKNVIKQSNGAMVNRKFRDVYGTGIKGVPTMIYCCRPSHVEILFEDCIKAAIFNRALIQYESRSDKFASYAEDRGYSEWLLPEIGANSSSHRKGDAPSGGKNAFLNEGIGLIDANTNLPLNPSDPYYLENHWFELLLSQYIGFSPLNTHPWDLVMADIQALVGAVKIMHRNIKSPSKMNDAVLNFLLN